MQVHAFDVFKQTGWLPSGGAFIFGANVPTGSWADINEFLVNKLAEHEWYAAAIARRKCRTVSIEFLYLETNTRDATNAANHIMILWPVGSAMKNAGESTNALRILQLAIAADKPGTLTVVVQWS